MADTNASRCCGGLHGRQGDSLFQRLGGIDWITHVCTADPVATGAFLAQTPDGAALETHLGLAVLVHAGFVCCDFHGGGDGWIRLLDSTGLVDTRGTLSCH